MRTGVLSDASIKKHCPELWPLQSDKSKLFHNFAPHTHPLTGIKHRYKEHHTFARYPQNDFNNYALLQFPGSREQAEERAIMNYRLATGSHNVPESKNDTPVVKAVDDVPTFGPFQITSRMRSQQITNFKKRLPGYGKFFNANAQAYIGALDEETEHMLLDYFSTKNAFHPHHHNGQVTAQDIHDYLQTSIKNKDQRIELANLLQQSKVKMANAYMDGLKGSTKLGTSAIETTSDTGQGTHTRFIDDE